jgi:hypothetical protein
LRARSSKCCHRLWPSLALHPPHECCPWPWCANALGVGAPASPTSLCSEAYRFIIKLADPDLMGPCRASTDQARPIAKQGRAPSRTALAALV